MLRLADGLLVDHNFVENNHIRIPGAFSCLLGCGKSVFYNLAQRVIAGQIDVITDRLCIQKYDLHRLFPLFLIPDMHAVPACAFLSVHNPRRKASGA